MIDQRKVILMSKLAIYDKKYGEADRQANSFFRHDYVYWKNFWNRLFALLGCFIIIGFYVFNRLVVNAEDLFEIDYRAEGVRLLLFVLAVLFACTLISSLKATREYSVIQKRIDRQLMLIEKLEGKGDKLPNYGADSNRKRRKR